MKVEEIVENLIKDIQDIQKNILRLKNSSEIPLIETDLILSKLRDIYESVYQLKSQEKPLVDQPESKHGKIKDTVDSESFEVEEGKTEVIQESAEIETDTTTEAHAPTVLELETEKREEVKEQPGEEDAGEKRLKQLPNLLKLLRTDSRIPKNSGMNPLQRQDKVKICPPNCNQNRLRISDLQSV